MQNKQTTMLDVIKKHWKISAVFAFLVVMAGVATFAQQFRGKYAATHASSNPELFVQVVEGSTVKPGGAYTLQFIHIVDGIPGQYNGMFDAESARCNLDGTNCNPLRIAPWGSYTPEANGLVKVTLPNTFAPGLYKARFRERGQTYYPWSNQIEIRVTEPSPTSLSVVVVSGGSVQPGGAYTLQFIRTVDGIPGPYYGMFDAESSVCDQSGAQCSTPGVGAWGSYVPDSSGLVKVTLPSGFAPGLYKARFRERGQASAPWSNQIQILVRPSSISQLSVQVVAGASVAPGGTYKLQFVRITDSIPGPYTGMFDAESIVCNLDGTNCNPPGVGPWGSYTPDPVTGLVTVTLPRTFAPGLYKARFRERGQANAPWSNQIAIKVIAKRFITPSM